MVLHDDGISTFRAELLHSLDDQSSESGGSIYKQGMVAHQKSSPRRKISSKLLVLLAGLDEMVPDFDWKALGVGVDGLYNLLGFKSFLTYQEFMIACGFVGRSYRGNNKPYFLANRFQEEASHKFRPVTRGKQKHWFLSVGRKKHRKPKSCGKEWTPPRIKLN